MNAAALAANRDAAEQPPPEDHRVRVGRERRTRMRTHLLNSVLQVCSAETARTPAVIDDVVRHAQVSRGTFYKYFDTLEQAVVDVAIQLGDEMTDGILSVYDTLDDPVMRTATGFQMFLVRALIDRDWGLFIAKIGLLREGTLLTRKIRGDIERGIETGDYTVPDVDTAVDLLMGAKTEAIRRLINGGASLGYVRMMASLVLRGFGVTPSKADKTVARALARLQVEAPSRIGWWREVLE